MNYAAQDIKLALRKLAQRKGRSHYELAVIRDVIAAYRDNTDHHLKPELDKLLQWYHVPIDLPEPVITKGQQKASDGQFKFFIYHAKLFIGSQKLLASLAGVRPSGISSLVKRGSMLLDTYEKLQPYFEEVRNYRARVKQIARH